MPSNEQEIKYTILFFYSRIYSALLKFYLTGKVHAALLLMKEKSYFPWNFMKIRILFLFTLILSLYLQERSNFIGLAQFYSGLVLYRENLKDDSSISSHHASLWATSEHLFCTGIIWQYTQTLLACRCPMTQFPIWSVNSGPSAQVELSTSGWCALSMFLGRKPQQT